MITEDLVRIQLTEWGKWAVSHGIDLGYPRSTPFQRMIRQSGGLKPNISDQDAEQIDAWVSLLKASDASSHAVLVLYYVCGIRTDKMDKFGFKSTAAKQLKRTGEHFVLGCMASQ